MTPKQQYKRINAEARKKLKQIIKDTCPSESGYILDIISCMLHWMRDYYKNGYNVWGMEQCEEDPVVFRNVPTRLETLNMAIQLYDKWQGCEEEYFILVDNDLVETMQKGGYQYTENGAKELHPDKTFMFKGESFNDAVSEFNVEYKKRRDKFFKYLGEHIEEWWD